MLADYLKKTAAALQAKAAPKPEPKPQSGNKLSPEDKRMVAATLFAEVGGRGADQDKGLGIIADSLLNRLNRPEFKNPKTLPQAVRTGGFQALDERSPQYQRALSLYNTNTGYREGELARMQAVKNLLSQYEAGKLKPSSPTSYYLTAGTKVPSNWKRYYDIHPTVSGGGIEGYTHVPKGAKPAAAAPAVKQAQVDPRAAAQAELRRKLLNARLKEDALRRKEIAKLRAEWELNAKAAVNENIAAVQKSNEAQNSFGGLGALFSGKAEQQEIPSFQQYLQSRMHRLTPTRKEISDWNNVNSKPQVKS